MVRAFNGGTRAAPFESLMVADIGDVSVNLFDLKESCKMIRNSFKRIVSSGCIPLTIGTDLCAGIAQQLLGVE